MSSERLSLEIQLHSWWCSWNTVDKYSTQEILMFLSLILVFIKGKSLKPSKWYFAIIVHNLILRAIMSCLCMCSTKCWKRIKMSLNIQTKAYLTQWPEVLSLRALEYRMMQAKVLFISRRTMFFPIVLWGNGKSVRWSKGPSKVPSFGELRGG